MRWTEIMEIKDPHEALRKINEKAKTENLPIAEMEQAVETYATMHNISLEEMAYLPNGMSVLSQ